MAKSSSSIYLALAGIAFAVAYFYQKSKISVPIFSSAEIAPYVDQETGYLNFDQSYGSVENQEEPSILDNFISTSTESFYGEKEDWGVQKILINADPEYLPEDVIPGPTDNVGMSMPNPTPVIPDHIEVSELINYVANHLKDAEGFRPYVYDDVNGRSWGVSKIGNPTIGFGHKLKPGESLDIVVDEIQAYDLLVHDVSEHLLPIIPAVHIPLSINQWIAITSLAYNAGAGAVKRSKFIKAVNAQNWNEAETQFKDWNKATVIIDGLPVKRIVGGLVNRRSREWALFAEPQNVVMLKNDN